MTSKKENYYIDYQKYPRFYLNDPIDWSIDPFKILNWRHNFVSLRWLRATDNPEFIEHIIASFFNFHYVEEKKNDLIASKKGDHTTSIRLGKLIELRALFSASKDLALHSIFKYLIDKDLEVLMREDLYRVGHNHGVMVDTSILKAAEEIKDHALLRKIAARGVGSLSALFTENGVTKEHSVSYQEFNLGVAKSFFHSAKKFLPAESSELLSGVIRETPKLLAAFTRENGEFFPLGDSFRKPASPAYHLARAENKDREQLSKASVETYCSDGFFSYRSTNTDTSIHFTLTSSWHSANHKQDDDTSFCLEVNGHMIFDDPGYTDQAKPEEGLLLRSEGYHSILTFENAPFSARNKPDHGSKITYHDCWQNGFEVKSEHTRVHESKITRRIGLSGNILTIYDVADTRISGKCAHAFVLSPDIQICRSGRDVTLLRYETEVAIISTLDCEGEWITNQIKYVGSDRRSIGTTTRLAYVAPIVEQRSFKVVLCK